MLYITVSTTTEQNTDAETTYEVEVPQFESLAEAKALWEEDGQNGDDVLLSILNAYQKQGATQGTKDPVRQAIREHGADSDEAQAAIAEAQENVRNFRVGAARGGTLAGGTTKTEARKRGEAIYADEETARLVDELLRERGLL